MCIIGSAQCSAEVARVTHDAVTAGTPEPVQYQHFLAGPGAGGCWRQYISVGMSYCDNIAVAGTSTYTALP